MVKQIGKLVAVLACVAPGAALAQGADTGTQQGAQQGHTGGQGNMGAQPGAQAGQPGAQGTQQGAKITLPPGAKLVATAEVDQVRAFPEQQSAKGKGTQEEIIGLKAVDRVFEADRSYQDVVRFFDQEAGQGGNTQLSRDTTSTSTSWTIKVPQGRAVNVIVRNTKPTTFEVVAASDVSADVHSAGGAPTR